MTTRLLSVAAVVAAVAGATAAEPKPDPKPVELLLVADNHGPEIWKELNGRFESGHPGIKVTPSIAQWSKQRELVLKKELNPDVVALGVGTDLDPLRRVGVIADDWSYQFPHRSSPFGSVIAFLVPKGNPRGIKDWPDLGRPDVRVLSANPKGSRTGRHAVLGVYGSVRQRGGSEGEARAFVADVFGRSKLPPVAPQGQTAPAADQPKFLPGEPGEVLLTWEKEAIDAAKASDGRLEAVVPPVSVRGDAAVALAVSGAARGTRAAAEAYARYLYSDEAQEIFARHGYRPVRPAALRKGRPDAPTVEVFDANDLFPDVAQGHEKFFGTGGLFEQARAAAK